MRLSTEFGILTEYTAFLAHEGTDFSQKDKVLSEAESLFRNRAIQTRSGLSSVNQDVNNQYQKSIACVNPRNKYLDAAMNKVATATVQQVCDMAFYKRHDGWVDSRLVDSAAGVRPGRVIAFGSEEFRDLAARLAREGRQGSIALRGDILMLVDGQPVLIKAPSINRENEVSLPMWRDLVKHIAIAPVMLAVASGLLLRGLTAAKAQWSKKSRSWSLPRPKGGSRSERHPRAGRRSSEYSTWRTRSDGPNWSSP